MVRSRKPSTLNSYLAGRGVSQNALARELGISAIFLSEIRRGKRTPSLALAIRIAKHCRVPIESLVPAVHTSPTSSTEAA
ncbi:MAG TPA: hypothetical protein DCQ64_19945 [Candidatus Rokubacteria bacterium]|nr:hypothetical protein [Candidatus Rokubacteria bacterium]